MREKKIKIKRIIIIKKMGKKRGRERKRLRERKK